ncbi:MAG: undecaprenyl-diphosphate phosphatase [Propionibacteriaceae bacterium]|nr:undecaprenyl-diphosphate phosphatase [Micropruina sp.]HBX82873.1 undecaprenyl-diphosphatase [Propionibacteriaceae bacterium]HBY23378.1 undecaprenyl-diphosphatase [Propionibacteriaceae bacterium]
MSWLEAIVLGIVQALSEFLPISSSAHVSIVGQLFFSGHDPGAAFTAVTQLGTQTAVLVYFWKDIVRIAKQWCLSLIGRVPRNDPDARMGWMIIIGTIPIVVLGLALQKYIQTTFRNLWVTVFTLAFFAIVLWAADRFGRKTRDLSAMTWQHSLIYGFAQALALVPGVSRSGASITAGLFLGYTRESAARFSFLMSLPAIFGSGLYELKDIAKDPNPAWGPIALATAIAFGLGYVVIAWLLKYISTHDFKPFVFYRLGLAALLAFFLVTNVMTPYGG